MVAVGVTTNNRPVVVDGTMKMKEVGGRGKEVTKSRAECQARRDALRQEGCAVVQGMRGNTGTVAGTEGAGTSQGGRRGGRPDTPEDGEPRRGVVDDLTVCSKPNEVSGVDVACKDVSDVGKYDGGRGEVSVVRSVVETNSRGTSRDRLKGGELVVRDGGRPGGGGEGGPSSDPLITKPNRVIGGLQGRIHMWELKTGSTSFVKQGEIVPGNNTEGESRVHFSSRNRKENLRTTETT